ncbi:phytanoyl-CoA dioxygenase family protein [Nonlabens tegetincola]|uniref:phytanoyl-CoA dioxygenase family protein n=1 Tax=Nonlabens tegetincola TaxID=323273 RepID=UPI000CF4A23B|nr:phytanoyl-CoA dioxygenase family protein [Nonlabens tegetincola]PQJ18522.1 hypothetical protein BST93_08535 [Nonlabens tegetincola]
MKYYLSEIKYLINEKFNKLSKSDEEFYEVLSNDGIAVIEDFLSDDTCKEIRNKIDHLIDVKSKANWEDKEKSDQRIMGVERFDKRFTDLFEVEKLNSIYAKYIDSKNMHGFIMTNRVNHMENNSGSGGGWHRDMMNRRQLKFMVYINDVSESNGCFEYLVGSHKPSMKRKLNSSLKLPLSTYRYSKENITELNKLGYNSTLYPAKRGTLIVFDSSGIHRGKPLSSGVRYAVTKYMWDTAIPKHILDLLNNN